MTPNRVQTERIRPTQSYGQHGPILPTFVLLRKAPLVVRFRFVVVAEIQPPELVRANICILINHGSDSRTDCVSIGAPS